MRTDYKFWYIRRDDDGFITEAAVRFFEGDVTTETEGERGEVTRYRRSARLQEADLGHLTGSFIQDASNNDACLYTPEHFGVIQTDAELAAFINGELALDQSRDPIDPQRP